jgi:plastocyanin
MVEDCRRIRERSFHRPGRPGVAIACLIASFFAGARTRRPEAAAADGGRAAGRLQGTVVVGPRLSARKIRFNLYADLSQPASAPEPPAEAGELRNVVVYFEKAEGLSGAPVPRPARPVMRQEGLTFVPHVLAIPRGSTVEFPNQDSIFHNVFSLSNAASFDLGRFPKGSSRSIRFDTAGIVKVFCHIHSDMSAVIFVLDNPFFAVPDPQGHYSIGDVPPGEYRVIAWHERARPLSKGVRIQPGQATAVDFTIPLAESASGE